MNKIDVMEEQLSLPEIDYDTAHTRAHLWVNVPSLLVFVGVFGGATTLHLWPWTVSLLLGVLITAVYSLVAINQWQNWLSQSQITREEAEIWRRRMGLDRRGRWFAGLVLLATVMWLFSLLT